MEKKFNLFTKEMANTTIKIVCKGSLYYFPHTISVR